MSNTLPSGVIRGVVVAGDANIPYYRTGRGESVLLLSDDPDFVAAMLAALPSSLGVFAPELSQAGLPKLGVWLWGFLDALGVQRATFVVARNLAGGLTELVRSDADRVAGLLVADAETGPTALARRIVDLLIAEAVLDR